MRNARLDELQAGIKITRRNNNLRYVDESESESEVAQSCPTLCDPIDWGLSGSSIHGIFQARVLEWIAIAFSKGSSWPRDQTRVSRIAGKHFTIWATTTLMAESEEELKSLSMKVEDGEKASLKFNIKKN